MSKICRGCAIRQLGLPQTDRKPALACTFRGLSVCFRADKCKYQTMSLHFLLRHLFTGYFVRMRSSCFTAMRSDRGENTTLVCGQAWLAR